MLLRGVGIAALCIVALVGVMLLGTALGWWGLWFTRHAAPYAEETRRITYGQSLAYQQGSQSDFENLCLLYREATDNGTRAMIRDTISRRFADYTGPELGANVRVCFSQLGLR